MMSEEAAPNLLITLGNLETLAEEFFTRPRSREINLKLLKEVASEVLHRHKAQTTILKRPEADISELAETIALVVGKTYVELGDSFKLADDEALVLIHDLLLQYNPAIVARNRNKRLPKYLIQ